MKTLKISMLALLFTVGIGGAVIQNIQAAPKVDDPTYNWSGSGPSGSGSLTGKTVAQAQAFYGCSSNVSLCATGIDPNQELPNVTIRKSN